MQLLPYIALLIFTLGYIEDCWYMIRKKTSDGVSPRKQILFIIGSILCLIQFYQEGSMFGIIDYWIVLIFFIIHFIINIYYKWKNNTKI